MYMSNHGHDNCCIGYVHMHCARSVEDPPIWSPHKKRLMVVILITSPKSLPMLVACHGMFNSHFPTKVDAFGWTKFDIQKVTSYRCYPTLLQPLSHMLNVHCTANNLKKPKKINIVLQTLNVSPLVEKMEDMFGPNTKPYDIGTYIAYGKDYPNSFRA